MEKKPRRVAIKNAKVYVKTYGGSTEITIFEVGNKALKAIKKTTGQIITEGEGSDKFITLFPAEVSIFNH